MSVCGCSTRSRSPLAHPHRQEGWRSESSETCGKVGNGASVFLSAWSTCVTDHNVLGMTAFRTGEEGGVYQYLDNIPPEEEVPEEEEHGDHVTHLAWYSGDREKGWTPERFLGLLGFLGSSFMAYRDGKGAEGGKEWAL